MGLAVVRTIDSPRRLRSAEDLEIYEQELVDQYALASTGAGIGDRQIQKERYLLFEFLRWFNRPVWTCQPEDAASHRWIKLALGKGLTATQIREDRILNEAHATGGGMRALVGLFGLSTNASNRYIKTVDNPELVNNATGGLK
jgi:hypothetical protein